MPDVSPELLQAIIQTESSGNPLAASKKGARGLMQIMPATAESLGFDPNKLYDPDFNMLAGKALLRRLNDKYKGDIPKVLAAYNAGETKIDRGIMPPETRQYVRKVMERMGSMASRVLGEGTASAEEMPSEAELDKWAGATPAPRAVPAAASTANVTKGMPTEEELDRRFMGPGEEKAKPVPLPARLGEYAPATGQMIGQMGLGLSAAPVAAGATALLGPEAGTAVESGAEAVGGAAGEFIGEGIKAATRYPYGLHNITPSQAGVNALKAGAVSGAMVPGAKILGKVLSPLLPMSLKGAIAGRKGFEAAEGANEQLMKALEQKLGVTRDEAEQLVTSDEASKLLRDPYFTSRTQAFQRLSDIYDRTLRPYKGKPTPNQSWKVADALNSGDKDLARLSADWPTRPPVANGVLDPPDAQAFRKVIRAQLRNERGKMQPDTTLIRKLEAIEQANTGDIMSVLNIGDRATLNQTDERFGNLIQRVYKRGEGRGINTGASIPEVGGKMVELEESQLKRMMDELDTLPLQERMHQIDQMQKGISAWVVDAARTAKGASKVVTSADRLTAVDKVLQGIPDGMFQRIYGGSSKADLHNMIQATMEMHNKFLARPDLEAAMRAEMGANSHLLRIAGHLAPKELMFLTAGWLAGGTESTAHLAAIGGVAGGLLAGSAIFNSPPAKRAYMQLASAGTPAAVRVATRALMAALVSSHYQTQPPAESGGISP